MNTYDDTRSALDAHPQEPARTAVPRHRARELGASMVEYILLVALIALAVIGAVTFLSQQTDSKFHSAGDAIKAAGSDGACGSDSVRSAYPSVEPPGTDYVCQASNGALRHIFVAA